MDSYHAPCPWKKIYIHTNGTVNIPAQARCQGRACSLLYWPIQDICSHIAPFYLQRMSGMFSWKNSIPIFCRLKIHMYTVLLSLPYFWNDIHISKDRFPIVLEQYCDIASLFSHLTLNSETYRFEWQQISLKNIWSSFQRVIAFSFHKIERVLWAQMF